MSDLIVSASQWDAMPPHERAQWEPMDASERFYARKPVPPKPEPTDEQLENLACALGFPLMATPMFKQMPRWRETMLKLHALTQRAADGDEDAGRRLAVLVRLFGAAA